MAWKTLIEALNVRPGGVTEIVATFVDEATGRKERVTTQVANQTLERIRQQLRFERGRLDTLDATKAAIEIGQPLDIDIPDTVIATSPEAIALAVYQAAYQRFRAVRMQFQDGLVEQKAVDDALTALRAVYSAEYLGVV